MERELRTVTKLVPGATTEVIREYRQLAERAEKLHIPQAHAEILQGAKQLTPGQALRPTSKAVRSLMQAAQAIKQGRLPFLPKETRREAQKLLNAVFSKQAAAQISKSSRIPQEIERQRLVPLAAQGMLEAAHVQNRPPSPLLGVLKRAVATPLISPQAPSKMGAAPPTAGGTGRAPVAAHDLPRLAKTLPSFASQGAGYGGALLSHADESMQVFTRSDSPLAAPDAATGEGEGQTPAPQAQSTRQPQGEVPPAPGQRAAGAGAAAAAGTPQAQTGGPVRIEGTMSIPELGDIVGKFTGFMTDNGALT